MFITGLMVASFALTAYSTYTAYEQAEEQAELQKANVRLQQRKLEAQERARKIKEDLEKAKLRREARKQQSNLAIKKAISGTTFSSMYSGIEQSLNTTLESNLTTQSTLSDISADIYGLSQDNLNLQYSSIQSPSELDLAIGIGSAGLSAGIGYYGYNQATSTTTAGNWTSYDSNGVQAYSSPVTSSGVLQPNISHNFSGGNTAPGISQTTWGR